jgi:SIR2-like domain
MKRRDSSIKDASVDELTFLFRAEEQQRPIVLLGAGASFASGIPLAGPMVNEIAKWSYARTVRNSTPDRIHVRRSEWEDHLKSQPWFRTDIDRAELYPDAVEHLLVPREFRRSFFQRIISDHPRPTAGYRSAAQLCRRHLISHFLTTNFDTLLETALRAEAPHIREVTTVNKTPGDLEAFSPNRKAQVIYLHGSVETYSDKSLRSETLNLDVGLLRRIHSLIEYSPVIVVGYRGAERSIMHGLFEKGITLSGKYRRGIYWCVRGTEAPAPSVISLHSKVGNNLRLVRIQGFDELLTHINQRLSAESLNPNIGSDSAPAISSTITRDSKPLEGSSVEDLDQSTLWAVLQEHYRRINDAEIRDLDAHLVEYEFAARSNGRLVPYFGLWLLFGRDVTEKLPYLKSIIRIGEKEQRVIEGNLLAQFNTIRQFLDSPEVNPVLRIKKAGIAEEKRAYHPRALIELLVNHFAHRDYGIETPCEIHVQPGEAISFRTLGGLPAGVLHQLAPSEDGAFHPRRGVREQRNPLLADIFYGMRIMDREGSGLVDVQQFALEHEGDAAFHVVENNATVVATIFQAKSDQQGRGRTARGLAGKTVFVANLFRIHDLPKTLYSTPLLEPFASKPSLMHTSGVDFDAIPPIRTHGGMLMTFQSLRSYADAVAPVAKVASEDPNSVSEWIANADRRKIIVALLGKYWQRFLDGFSKDGLAVNGKVKRAWFTPEAAGTRTIIYDASFRKAVPREVVKDRETFKECEGISYSVERFGDVWAVQVKPIYVFTDADGRSLSGLMQTRRATRRYKFDRNIQVVQDLNFWIAYLFQKAPVYDLSGTQDFHLFLDGSFLEVEATSSDQ